jgi:hypothetical protein
METEHSGDAEPDAASIDVANEEQGLRHEQELIGLLFDGLEDLFRLARESRVAAITATLDVARRTARPGGRVNSKAVRSAMRAAEAAQAVVLKMVVMHGQVARLTDVRVALREREQLGQSYGARH